jgi:hypothetical protein
MSQPLIIETKVRKSHGLETYEVRVNGTLLNTFMSKQAAETKKAQIMFAWNCERVGQSKRVA